MQYRAWRKSCWNGSLCFSKARVYGENKQQAWFHTPTPSARRNHVKHTVRNRWINVLNFCEILAAKTPMWRQNSKYESGAICFCKSEWKSLFSSKSIWKRESLKKNQENCWGWQFYTTDINIASLSYMYTFGKRLSINCWFNSQFIYFTSDFRMLVS